MAPPYGNVSHKMKRKQASARVFNTLNSLPVLPCLCELFSFSLPHARAHHAQSGQVCPVKRYHLTECRHSKRRGNESSRNRWLGRRGDSKSALIARGLGAAHDGFCSPDKIARTAHCRDRICTEKCVGCQRSYRFSDPRRAVVFPMNVCQRGSVASRSGRLPLLTRERLLSSELPKTPSFILPRCLGGVLIANVIPGPFP